MHIRAGARARTHTHTFTHTHSLTGTCRGTHNNMHIAENKRASDLVGTMCPFVVCWQACRTFARFGIDLFDCLFKYFVVCWSSGVPGWLTRRSNLLTCLFHLERYFNEYIRFFISSLFFLFCCCCLFDFFFF